MPRSIILLTAGSLVLLVPACGDDSEESARPLTIMPIGDSITSGETGWSTYRCYLDGMLNEAGVSFDFVGRQSEPFGGDPYGCPNPFDHDHEGWWGRKVDDLIDDVTASVEVLQPDVALVHLGTNDLYYLEGPVETAEELESFITGLQAVSPDITILVAQIIPCDRTSQDCADDLPAFNDIIASFASLSTDRSLVAVVDMETGFSLGDLRDPWHPADAGDEIIASRWMTALQEAGVIGTSG